MASLYPAQAIGIEAEYGHLRPGAMASFAHLSDERRVRATWIAGEEVWRG
jgi:N-acetylglucosamine-6-phosphate deacetylase